MHNNQVSWVRKKIERSSLRCRSRRHRSLRSNEPTLYKKRSNIKNVVVVVPYWVLMSQFTVASSSSSCSSFYLFYHSLALSFNNFLSRLISVAEHDNRIIKIHNFSEALDNSSSSTNEVSLSKRPSERWKSIKNSDLWSLCLCCAKRASVNL